MTRTRGCVSFLAPLVLVLTAVEIDEAPDILLVMPASDARVQPAVLQTKVPLKGNEFSTLLML